MNYSAPTPYGMSQMNPLMASGYGMPPMFGSGMGYNPYAVSGMTPMMGNGIGMKPLENSGMGPITDSGMAMEYLKNRYYNSNPNYYKDSCVNIHYENCFMNCYNNSYNSGYSESDKKKYIDN
jgi:hypothetical protein